MNVARKYYSTRVNPRPLSLPDLYQKLRALYLYFRDLDYFKGLAGITSSDLPEKIKHKARLNIPVQPFPITKWKDTEITESRVFDVIEFLHDHVAKPGEMANFTTDSGWNYSDYDGYDEKVGRDEFRAQANQFLTQYGEGFELSKQGEILRIGKDGVSHIFDAGIIPYDDANVDSKVRLAIQKWRSRSASLDDKKSAILELADVFEWLKKSKKLEKVLDRKDESDLFEIANQFALRHHNPKQKSNYDRNIWYAWIFHFYLATYHAVVRMLVRKERA